MYLRALYLHNFRIYEEALFEFSPNINLIHGPNARGKTSLLEAIYFLMTGRSFRTAQVSDLIRHGANFFYLDAHFVKHGIEQKLRVTHNGKERKIIYNSTSCSSSLSLLGLLQGGVIHPDDAAIVKGAPATRRHLMDVQLAQVDPLYVHHLARYERAMRQRNYLLRAKKVATIDSWEYEMANAAAYVVQQRARLVEDLQQLGKERYNTLCGGKEIFSLLYKAHGAGEFISSDSSDLRKLYSEQFIRHRSREMEVGVTLTGPHKDDITIALEKKDARVFASEGQQRSCVVALRLAEWSRLKNIVSEEPLMLVDDIGMSMDGSRRDQLLEHLTGMGQVFLTSTEGKCPVPEARMIAM